MSERYVCENCGDFATVRHRIKDDRGPIDVVFSCNSTYCKRQLDVVGWPVIVCKKLFSKYEGGLFATPSNCQCGDRSYAVARYKYVGSDDPNGVHHMPGVGRWRDGISYAMWCGYMDCPARPPLPSEVPEDYEFFETFISPAGHFHK